MRKTFLSWVIAGGMALTCGFAVVMLAMPKDAFAQCTIGEATYTNLALAAEAAAQSEEDVTITVASSSGESSTDVVFVASDHLVTVVFEATINIDNHTFTIEEGANVRMQASSGSSGIIHGTGQILVFGSLRLDGMTITCNAKTLATTSMIVGSTGYLEITNSSIIAEGYSSASSGGKSKTAIDNSGTVLMKSGVVRVSADESQSAVLRGIDNKGTLTILDGTIQADTLTDYGPQDGCAVGGSGLCVVRKGSFFGTAAAFEAAPMLQELQPHAVYAASVKSCSNRRALHSDTLLQECIRYTERITTVTAETLTQYEYVVLSTNTTDHEYGEWIAEIPATCEEPGTLGHYACTICGKCFDAEEQELTSLEIPALGHLWGDWIVTTPPTSTAEGVETRYCDRDSSHFETRPIDMLPVAFTVTFDSNGGSPVDPQQVVEGETTTRPQDPTYEGYAFLGWFTEESAFDFSTPITADLTLTAHWEAIPTISGHNLLLSSEIGVQFRVIFPDGFDTTGVYMDFAASDGRTGTMQLAAADPISGQNAYWFTFFVNALELADTVTATLHYGDGELVDDFSAVRYIDAARQVHADKPKLIALINALQNYGYYMQQSGWTDGKSHAPIEMVFALSEADVEAARSGVAAMEVVKELEDSGIADARFGLTLNAATVVNVFVLPGEGVSIVSPNPAGTQAIGGETYYRFDSVKIGAGNLGKVYTVSVTTDVGTAHVRVSAMSYVFAVLNGTSFTQAKQYAMAAYYNYYAAADAY